MKPKITSSTSEERYLIKIGGKVIHETSSADAACLDEDGNLIPNLDLVLKEINKWKHGKNY